MPTAATTDEPDNYLRSVSLALSYISTIFSPIVNHHFIHILNPVIMSKDGDIIDFLFSSIVSLVGWILGGIVKLAMALIGGLFSVIFGLFKKDNPTVE